MSGRPRSTPRLAVALIRRLVEPTVRAAVLGDLEERFGRRTAAVGTGRARLWYWRQALAFGLRVPGDRARLVAVRSRAAFLEMLGGTVRDLVFAARNLRARPGFTLPVIAVFALAIAANTLVFSLVDAVLLRGLPYADADAWMFLWDRPTDREPRDGPISTSHFESWRQRRDLFAYVGGYESNYDIVQWEGATEQGRGLFVSAGLLDGLGARPQLGRLILPADDRPGAAPVMVLSHRAWVARFGADADVVRRSVVVDDRPVRIVGVLEPGFWFYDPYMFSRSIGDRSNAEAEFWMPLDARELAPEMRDSPALRVMARLRADVAPRMANEAVAAHRARLRVSADEPVTAELTPLRTQMLGEFDHDLQLLAAAVLLVLAVACANVVTMLLGRLAARRHEVAVRRALGAGDRVIARLIVVESALLGVLGGLAGLVAAAPVLAAVVRLTPREMPLVHRVAIDPRSIVWTVALSIAAGIAVGLVQAGVAFRDRGSDVARSARPRRARGGALRFVMTAGQVAVSIALLVVAATAATTFIGLLQIDPGFEAERTLTFQTFAGDPEGDFLDRLIEGIRGIPGVEDAVGSAALPFSRWGVPRFVRPFTEDTDTEPIRVAYRHVTDRFFDMLRIPLLTGRTFSRGDDGQAPLVAILNRVAVERLGLGDEPLGSRLRLDRGGPQIVEVVGVVGNTLHWRLGERPEPVVYVPMRQAVPWGLHVAARIATEPEPVIAAIRRLGRELDPGNPIGSFEQLDDLVRGSIARQEFFARLLAIFGALALALACTGIYGALGYAARLRLPEMGVRKALGARSAGIRRLMLLHSARPVALGIAAGVPAAVALERLLAATVPGTESGGVLQIATVVAAFCVAAALAALRPAGLAASVDPARALREDA